MDPHVTVDDLTRAAEAAGYALACADEQFDAPARTTAVARAEDIEERARGARETAVANTTLPVAAVQKAEAGFNIKGRLTHGASVVRHSVSGYLRLGTPA